MNILVPLNRKVVVEPETQEKVSAGGIVIPETANQKAPTRGRVIAIAEDSDLKLKVSAGDVVFFSKYSGVEVTITRRSPEEKDRHLQIIKDEDILAKLEVEK